MNVAKETVPEEAVDSAGAGKASIQDSKLENLLEQLRAKHSQASSTHDSWNDFAKQIRMASLERKQYRESAVVHETLEKLQNVIAASSLNQILERIDSACQKLGMKYKLQGNQAYISTTQFYVEITCDVTPNNRSVREVRITHQGSLATSVPAMTQALRQASVKLFMDHIKGFLDMYNVGSDQALRSKYFIVLQSLESDIEKINKCTILSKNMSMGAHLYSTPLGFIQPRSGGLPTKLTFYITPYDFLNEKDQTVYPMTLDTIKANDLGASATVGVEPHSNTHQLQTIPLVNFTRSADNRLVPHFAACNNVNSVSMQAAFVLKFKKPIALSETAINQIERLNSACTFSNKVELIPMLDAIVKSSELNFPVGTQRFTVTLPGQVQRYFINNLETASGEPLKGGLVHSIPFSHPTVIPQIIARLRQQLMINSMILSCVRSTPSQHDDCRQPIALELKLVTNQLLMASFKHPFHDSMIAVDVDISELNSPKCSIFSNVGDVCTNSHATKVIQRSYSIPITVRAILRQAGHQEENLPPPTKKVKADHAETVQKLVDLYTARGHYMPYGSVNTASSTTCTKNIQFNRYCLCLRRFSGYKRPSSVHLKSSHPLLLNTSSTNAQQPTGHPTHLTSLPTQASDRSRISHAPVLASLLDEKDQTAQLTTTNSSTNSAHPLVSPPTQTATPQQQAPILTDLLEGPEGLLGAEKKARKNRNPKTASDNIAVMPTGSGGPVSVSSPAGRKRKPSTSKEVVKELTAKVQAEVSSTVSFQPVTSQAFSMAALMTPSPTTATPSTPKSSMSKPAFPKPAHPTASTNETPLTKLLHGLDEEQRTRLNVKTVVMTAADVLEQERVQQEASSAGGNELKLQLPSKVAKRKSADDRKTLKQQSASVDSASKEKKLKRSDSIENPKLKESKSFDSGQPGRVTVKTKASKPPTSKTSPLNVKAAEDRSSPKDKAKKPSKKKTPKSPASSEPAGQGGKSNQDVTKMGFYGASNLKSLPKIPKRKIDETQASPTSPTTPSLAAMTQRSPIISSRSLPGDQPVTANRVIPLVTNSSESAAKRPALLPTPSMPPIDMAAKANMLQRNKSLDDVIHRLSSQSSTTSNYANPSSTSYTSRLMSMERPHSGSPAPITSPEDSGMGRYNDSAPVHIPIQAAGPDDPASPVMEFVTQTPKTIPLDTSRLGRAQPVNSSSNQSSDRSQAVSSSSSGGSSLNPVYI